MKKRLFICFGVLTLLLLLSVLKLGRPVAAAETRAGLSLERSVLSSGGVIFDKSEPFTLGSTIGQNQAGVLEPVGYWASIGFWFESWLETLLNTYLPLILK